MNKPLKRKWLDRAAGILPFAILWLLLISAEPLLSQPQDSQSAFIDAGEQPIKIGLLITADTAANALTRQAVHVVEIVIDRLNDSGGIRGKPLKAIVKSVDGNWGAGSRQSVDLIYEDGVVALLGYLDGRSAHLVEQVCTKAEIPFISTYSPDPTLSRINIPWFFSTVPSATRQGAALAEEIYERQQKSRVAMVTTDDYDMRFLADSFKREVERRSLPAPNEVAYQPEGESMFELASPIREGETEAIVFFGNPEQWTATVSQLSAKKMTVPVFLPVMDWDNTVTLHAIFPVYAITPDNLQSAEADNFRKEFFKRFGDHPGMTAYYVYDGATALLQAIDARGERSAAIRKGLDELTFTGLFGRVSFDDTGEIEYQPAVRRINGPEVKQ